MDKHEIRRAMKARREALPAEESRARSARLCDRLRALPELAAARTVAAYVAIDGEADPGPLLDELRAAGRRICLPRVGERDRVTFHEAGGAQAPDARGIPAPVAGAPAVGRDEIDVWLVPGLAFDAWGHRVGRGAGHYDDVLRGARGFKIGLGYEFQLAPEVPFSRADVALDALVTDERVLRSRGEGAG